LSLDGYLWGADAADHRGSGCVLRGSQGTMRGFQGVRKDEVAHLARPISVVASRPA